MVLPPSSASAVFVSSRTNRLTKILAGALLAALSLPCSASCDWDEFPVMKSMSLAPVLNNATHNRQTLAVKEFRTPDSVEALERFYWRKWEAPVPSVVAPWKQLSKMITDTCFATVQYQVTDTGAAGRLVMSEFSANAAGDSLGAGLLLPDDAIVASDTLMDDELKSGRVTLIATSMSPDEVARFYIGGLRRQGWELEPQFNEQEAHVMIFRDGPALVNVLVIPAPDITQVLINTEIPN